MGAGGGGCRDLVCVHGERGTGKAPHLPIDGGPSLLDINKPVAHARRDAPCLEHRRQQHRVLRAVAGGRAGGLGSGGVGGAQVLVGDKVVHHL
jgi:hypothetical protein